MRGFKLIPGVSIPDVSAVKKEYRLYKNELTLSLSAEDYKKFFTDAVGIIGEPVFFFIEIPADDDSMRLYYLDNCTVPVARPIIKRYGDILFSDGVIRFGFGGNKSSEEVYMREYQTLSVYTERAGEYEKLLSSLGYSRNPKAVLTWDIIGEKNAAECVNVDADGEGYADIVNNLIDIGMYPAE